MAFRRPLSRWLPSLYVCAQLVSAILKQLLSHLETMHVALAVPVLEDGLSKGVGTGICLPWAPFFFWGVEDCGSGQREAWDLGML